MSVIRSTHNHRDGGIDVRRSCVDAYREGRDVLRLSNARGSIVVAKGRDSEARDGLGVPNTLQEQNANRRGLS